VLFTRIVLQLSSLAYAAVGLTFLAAPAFMASLVGVAVVTATADNDVRAVYGGVSSGLAVFFWWAAFRAEWFRPALVVQVLTLAGLASGRFLSWAVVGFPDPIGFGLHAGEIVGLAAGSVALHRNRHLVQVG
jgi:hypothetical protein